MDPTLLDQAEFADNPEPRCPVVLALDTSGSMAGNAILELNQGLRAFGAALRSDPLAALRVEVAVVTFGGKVRAINIRGEGPSADTTLSAYNPRGLALRPRPVEVPFDAHQAFTSVERFDPPALDAAGGTPMGEAMQRSLALLRDRKEIYKANGLDYFRPWVFLIADGKPTDRNWEAAAEQARQEEARKGVIVYAVGVEGADLNVLGRFSGERPPLRLNGLAFGDLFNWLSKSLSVIARSRPGEQAPLPPVGWGSIDTSHS